MFWKVKLTGAPNSMCAHLPPKANKESNFPVTKTEWVDIEHSQSGLKSPHGPDEVETWLWNLKPPRHHVVGIFYQERQAFLGCT